MAGRGDIKEQLIFKNIIYIMLIILGFVLCMLKLKGVINIDNARGESLYDGFVSCFIIVSIARIIKNIRIIRNKKRLERYNVMVNDERNIAVQKKALSVTLIACVCIGMIIALLFIFYDTTISLTILYSICFVLVVYLLFSFIFNKIM